MMGFNAVDADCTQVQSMTHWSKTGDGRTADATERLR